MPRTISSRGTVLLKVIAGLWIGLFMTVTLYLAYAKSAGSRVPLPFLSIFMAATVLGTLVMVRNCLRCKRVVLDGDSLLISTFRRSAVVPLAEIETIRQNRWLSTRQVTIKFRHPTPFGRSIIFLPQIVDWVVAFPAPDHPIIKELRAAAAGQGPAPGAVVT